MEISITIFLVFCISIIVFHFAKITDWPKFSKPKAKPETPIERDKIEIIPVQKFLNTEVSKTLPFSIDRVDCIMFDQKTETYGFFTSVYPELHVWLQTKQTLQEDQIKKLGMAFASCFASGLKIRVFLTDRDKPQSNLIH